MPSVSVGRRIEAVTPLDWIEQEAWRNWGPPSRLFENGEYYQERRRDLLSGLSEATTFFPCNVAITIDPRNAKGEDIRPFVSGMVCGWLEVPSLVKLSNAWHKNDFGKAVYPGLLIPEGSKNHLTLVIWPTMPVVNGILLVLEPEKYHQPDWENHRTSVLKPCTWKAYLEDTE